MCGLFSNVAKITPRENLKAYVEYEKQRKLTDPEFKLLKTLRSRLANALSRQNATKNIRSD